MAETASLIYGWQFDPSYYEVVRDTLATNVSLSDNLAERLAPIALPTPVSAVPYQLDKASPPPPLVEGALYGAYIPKTLYADVTSEGAFTGEVPPLSAPPPQSMAWPELAKVFIPGLNGDKGNKTECWFFPLYWMGRVSDRNNVAVLPLLGRHKTSTFRKHFKNSSYRRSDAGLPPFSPTNPVNLHWEVLDPKEFTKKFSNTTNWQSFVRELNRECDDCVPELKQRIADAQSKGGAALEDFPRLASPYVIPNVSWERITIYMDGVLSTMKDYYVQDSRPDISEAAIELPSDFGSTATAAVIMDKTHEYMANNDPSKLFTWWGMAHTEWLEAYKKRAQTTIVNYLATFIDAGYVEKDALRTFSMTGFPFKTEEGLTIVRGEDLRAPNRETMTPKGREFFEKMIEPVVAAGGAGGLEIPDITVEEAQQIEEDAREAEKAARQAAGAQGDASKNVTATKNAKEKAEVGLASAIDEENAADLALEELEGGSSYKELEKAKKTVATLAEMEMPVPEKLEKTVADLQKKIGKEIEKASESATKARAKVVAATNKETQTSAAFAEAERILEKVKVAHKKAEDKLEDAIKQTAVIKALSSHIYVPSYEGYASFIQDVRKGYSVSTLTNTGQEAVGTAFRWFSGSPQAASGQTGRWSADSAWESEKNAATSALKDRKPIGGFQMPSKPRERVLAGPIPVDMMDGSQTTMQVGRPNKMKRGSYVVFEDLGSVFADEFVPLFTAYGSAYPAEEVEAGYENLVFEITEEAKTNKEGRWVATIQPVAFFSPSYHPVAEFEGAVKDVPFGETQITIDSSDPFVMIPALTIRQGGIVSVAGAQSTPKKNPTRRKKNPTGASEQVFVDPSVPPGPGVRSPIPGTPYMDWLIEFSPFGLTEDEMVVLAKTKRMKPSYRRKEAAEHGVDATRYEDALESLRGAGLIRSNNAISPSGNKLFAMLREANVVPQSDLSYLFRAQPPAKKNPTRRKKNPTKRMIEVVTLDGKRQMVPRDRIMVSDEVFYRKLFLQVYPEVAGQSDAYITKGFNVWIKERRAEFIENIGWNPSQPFDASRETQFESWLLRYVDENADSPWPWNLPEEGWKNPTPSTGKLFT